MIATATRRILVIDDSLTLRKFIEKTLLKQGEDWEVVTANDGRQGLQRAMESTFDLILLDYMLPDAKGEDICSQLLAQEQTASVPVVLMGSYTDEIRKTRSDYPNVVDAMNKPFSPELLVATTRCALTTQVYVPSQQESPAPAPSRSNGSSGNIRMLGRTGFISLAAALRGLEENRMTGVLRVYVGRHTVDVYTAEGRVVLVTTKDVSFYLKDSSFAVAPNKMWQACEKGQSDSGCPLFLLMAEKNLMPRAMVNPLLEIHGHRLFSRLWTMEQVQFDFEELAALPPFVAGLQKAARECMDEWILKTLRYVEPDPMHDQVLEDYLGIPVLRRIGYENLRRFSLNREETAFISLINAVNTLADICGQMGIPLEEGKKILFRFLSIDYVEFWPSAYFAVPETQAAQP